MESDVTSGNETYQEKRKNNKKEVYKKRMIPLSRQLIVVDL